MYCISVQSKISKALQKIRIGVWHVAYCALEQFIFSQKKFFFFFFFPPQVAALAVRDRRNSNILLFKWSLCNSEYVNFVCIYCIYELVSIWFMGSGRVVAQPRLGMKGELRLRHIPTFWSGRAYVLHYSCLLLGNMVHSCTSSSLYEYLSFSVTHQQI